MAWKTFNIEKKIAFPHKKNQGRVKVKKVLPKFETEKQR